MSGRAGRDESGQVDGEMTAGLLAGCDGFGLLGLDGGWAGLSCWLAEWR